MRETVVLGNGTVVTSYGPSGVTEHAVIPGGAVAWTGDRIVAVGRRSELLATFPGARFLDAHGGIVAPGLINLHHHFYSALARGLNPGTRMRNFAEVLDRLWWRLDRALDPDTIEVSARLSLLDCIRWGCTTVFDHHASPNHIAGSLDLIAAAVEEAGLSAVLCYEVTDRNGHDQALEGIAENARFEAAHTENPRIRGVMGLHASFTLRDETLREAASNISEGAGCHIHVAEDPVDVESSRAEFGREPVQRLIKHGLLGERSLLAHGIHLHRDDYEAIAAHGGMVIHNPESNANNGVGHLDVEKATTAGCLVGLGTDGMSSSMLGALRASFLVHRSRTGDSEEGFDTHTKILANNALVARRFIDEPLLGELHEGAPADVIVIDGPDCTPVTSDNLFAHLVYGAGGARIRHTIAHGHVLMEDFEVRSLDADAIVARAQRLTPSLWERFGKLEWGSGYLGE